MLNPLFLKRTVSVFLLSAVCLGGSFLFSQANGQTPIERRHFTVRPSGEDIRIDGVLDEKAWAEADVIDLIYEWTPGDNVPPPVDTDFLVTYSEKYLYMAFRCFDPDPKSVRAHIMDRDSMDTFIQDDHVTVMIDPFNDERRGFQFRVNPLGVQADANFSEMEGYEDFSWDAIWKTAGRPFDRGWAVEIAIPFNQLRFPKTGDIQTWGISAERSYPRSVRHRITSHKRRRDVNCIFCQFDKVTGFQGMKTGMNLEVDPTLTANRTDIRQPALTGDMENGKIEADPGLSLRWGITPNLILNAAVNPDFSQVEADVRELEVNRRFAIRYPEKRPFFLEGADFFLTPLEAVFTRTVADPDLGFKFTGKSGRNAWGAFGTYDQINNLIFPANQGSASYSAEENIWGGVFRYRRDMGRNSALGALYTGRSGDGYFNHVGGVDGFFRLSRTKTINFQYLHSETQYPENIVGGFSQEEGRFGGNALFANFQHTDRNWMYAVNYQDLSPGFRGDFGYIPRVDYRRASFGVNRQIWGQSGDWYTRLLFGVTADWGYDYDGNLTDREYRFQTLYMGPLQSTVMAQYSRNRTLFGGSLFDLNSYVLFGEIKPRGGLSFSMTGVVGDDIDFTNVRKSGALVLSPTAEISLGRHLNVNLRHSLQRLSYAGSRVFLVNLSQVRLIYNINVRTFVRAIVQYMNLDQNPAMYAVPVQPNTRTVFTQFLFSYKLNPQTVLFLGYSDNYLGLTGFATTQSNRTFFVKIGYAWLR
jgi:hypothetical protein